MKTTLLKKSILVTIPFAASLLSAEAFAQVSTQVRDSVLKPTSVGVEVKPLPAVLSFTPGVGSAGVGVELLSGDHLSTFLQGYVLSANLPSRLRNEPGQDEYPVVHRVQGYSGDIGERYYTTSTNLDSLYGGLKLGYTFSSSQWGYQDENVHHSFRSLTPGLEGGYRWVWAKGLLMRLGLGADGNIIQENRSEAVEAETVVTNDAEDKITGGAQVAVVPRVDFGVGYAF